MKPYVQTFSVMVPSAKCNAKCPYCVSHMTGYDNMTFNEDLYWRNLRTGARYAVSHGATTCLITGKGEPLMYDKLLNIVQIMSKYFPVIEVQTNGMLIDQMYQNGKLAQLFAYGVNTLAISCVSKEREDNVRIFGDDYLDLFHTINEVHLKNIVVRLSLLGVNGYVDNAAKLREFVDYAREHNVEQITFRDLDVPVNPLNQKVAQWVHNNRIGKKYMEIFNEVENELVELSPLTHGSKVYDWNGQNICFANCLTESINNDIRQLILFPDGHVRYSWQYAGAILF